MTFSSRRSVSDIQFFVYKIVYKFSFRDIFRNIHKFSLLIYASMHIKSVHSLHRPKEVLVI